jgi:hypothetical protein
MFVLLGLVLGLALVASGRPTVGGILLAISAVRAVVVAWRSRARRSRREVVTAGRFGTPLRGLHFPGPVYDTTASDRGAA